MPAEISNVCFPTLTNTEQQLGHVARPQRREYNCLDKLITSLWQVLLSHEESASHLYDQSCLPHIPTAQLIVIKYECHGRSLN